MKVAFIGIGVQKAATSWLHDVLSTHPAIDASTPKELDFFTHHFDRGYEWYEDRFAGTHPHAKRGECSPSYFYSRSAPARAASYNPDLRVIVILRDPVARAFSNHLHEIRKDHIPESRSFEDALRANPMYLEQGRYEANLSRWLGAFGRDAVLVLLAEDIANDPVSAFESVCAHLSVSTDTRPEELGRRSHESVTSKNRQLQKVLRLAGNGARSLGLGKAVTSIKSAPGIRDLLTMNKRDLRAEILPMRAETRDMLQEYFQQDIAFVSNLLGRNDLPWHSSYHSKTTPGSTVGNTQGLVHEK